MSKHYAVVSIGTNSTRVLLADMAPAVPHVALARSVGTRIGEGMRASGRLDETAITRTLDTVRSHLRAVRGHYLRLFVIATSAVRRAENRDAFAQRVGELAGVPLRVLDGEEEAVASYRGATTALDARGAGTRAGVIDTGGGSTEYAIGGEALPERTTSCEIGAVRLTEAIPALGGSGGSVDAESRDAARAQAREGLAPLADFAAVDRAILVGGTATNAAAMLRGVRGKLDRYEVTRAELQSLTEQLCAMPLAQRKAIPGIKAQRADILPAGLILLDTALEIVKHDRALVTAADLLMGFLIEQRAAAGSAAGPSIAGRSVPLPASR